MVDLSTISRSLVYAYLLCKAAILSYTRPSFLQQLISKHEPNRGHHVTQRPHMGQPHGMNASQETNHLSAVSLLSTFSLVSLEVSDRIKKSYTSTLHPSIPCSHLLISNMQTPQRTPGMNPPPTLYPTLRKFCPTDSTIPPAQVNSQNNNNTSNTTTFANHKSESWGMMEHLLLSLTERRRSLCVPSKRASK